VTAGAIALPARTRAGIRVLRRRALTLALLAAALAATYLLWFRDSSLVAVKTVRIVGTGAGDAQLEQSLRKAGRRMTTLDVDHGALAEVVRPFPVVKSLSADPTFPSTLTIEVTERHPAALIGGGSDAVAVAGDGMVLRGVPASRLDLPQLPLSAPPKRGRLRGPVRGQAQVLGAAPRPLRPYLDRSVNDSSGIGVVLDGGVELRFGSAARAADKWQAAAAVLSDPGLGALDYVDLSVPSRPAVGGSGHSPPAIGSG
jgi:cell division protein FtsQ